MALQIGVQRLLAAPVAVDGAEFTEDEAFHVGLGGFSIFGVGSVVSDLGLGHDHDLTCVGGVRQNLLVPRHGGVEDHLPQRLGVRTEGDTLVHGPIFQVENCLLAHVCWILESGGSG